MIRIALKILSRLWQVPTEIIWFLKPRDQIDRRFTLSGSLSGSLVDWGSLEVLSLYPYYPQIE